jgi:RNA 2',3'-cyclic 3'-phosphodiesterase
MVRLFVALDLPENVRQALRESIEPLKTACPKARWVRPEMMHVTLKFIGHIEAEKLDSVLAALLPVRSEQPVEMEFRGLGFFPSERRPRVVWCRVEASANLAALAADIESSLDPIGIASESREFIPHLTLARLDPEKVPQGSVEKLVHAASELKATDFGSSHDAEFYLFESILKPSGAEYKRLQTFPFVKGPA